MVFFVVDNGWNYGTYTSTTFNTVRTYLDGGTPLRWNYASERDNWINAVDFHSR